MKKRPVRDTESFITRANEVHRGFYDYSKSVYVNAKTKLIISCPLHGDYLQQPSNHLNGRVCIECSKDKFKKTRANTSKKKDILKQEKYQENKNLGVDDTTKYSKEEANRNKLPTPNRKSLTSVGDFYNGIEILHFGYLPHRDKNGWYLRCHCGDIFSVGNTANIRTGHTKSCGCTKVETNIKQAYTIFLKECEEIKPSGYDLSLFNLQDWKDNNLKVICPTHGVQPVSKSKFRSGSSCFKCGRKRASTKRVKSTEDYIAEVEVLHPDIDFSETVYTSVKERLQAKCKLSGEYFTQVADYLLHGYGCNCSSCSKIRSKEEHKIFKYIESLGLTTISSDRSIIKPFELDIVIPQKKIAIEYNGIRWHSEAFGKDKDYHKNKTKLCKDAGYRLIHIWEDEFLENPERELNFLKHVLGRSDSETVYARNTEIKEIPNKIGREFLDKYHVQGSGTGSIYLGTFYKEKLMAVTSFVFKDNKTFCELTRHTTSKNVVGSLGKVTKHFSRLYKIDILSFCDLARFEGKSYKLAGFEEVGVIPPDYKYAIDFKRQHKFNWRRKNIQSKLPEVYSEELTEKQMMELAEIPRIWDCGKIKFIYKHKN